MLLCLVFSAWERHQIHRVPLPRKSTAMCLCTCTEVARPEPVLNPWAEKRRSTDGEQLVRKGRGGAVATKVSMNVHMPWSKSREQKSGMHVEEVE